VLSVGAFIAILIVGSYIAGWVCSVIRGGLDRPRFDSMLVKFAGNFVYYAIWILALLAELEAVGVEMTSFVAVLAAGGFAVGFAMQGTLANFAAGIGISYPQTDVHLNRVGG
jgi:small conductance mechanosensitive channel